MNVLFKYYEGELKDFIAEALVTKDTLIKRVISPASERLVVDLKSHGIQQFVLNDLSKKLLADEVDRNKPIIIDEYGEGLIFRN